MFVLQKNPFILATTEAASEKIGWARQRLADSSRGLTFEPKEHRYFLAGNELRSVSTIVEHFAPMDSIAMAKKCSANPKHPLFGMPFEEILSVWEQKRDDSAAAGTAVHAFGEACCSFLLGKEDEIEPEFRDRITADGLVATTPKEEAMAKWWTDMDWSRFAVVAKETRIVNPVLRYAGTFDLLLFDLARGSFVQKDYKTNEDLYKWYGDMLQPPLSMIRANCIGKYTVQQTLYTIVLRNIGLEVSSNGLVWLREDLSYEDVELETRYDKVISFAVNQMNFNN